MRQAVTRLVAAAIVLASAPAFATDSVNVQSQIAQDQVGLDQTLEMTVTVTTHGGASAERVELPQSSAFELLGTSRSEQSRFSMGPGGVDSSHSTVYELRFRPLRTGDQQLSAAQVTSGGHTYKSNPVRVRVLPAGQGPTQQRRQAQNPFGGFFGNQGFSQVPGFPGDDDFLDGQDPFEELFGGRPTNGDDVLLSATVDKKQAALGQQITYTVRLFTRADVSEFSDLKLPGFDGFWGEDLETPTHPVPKVQMLGGVPYQVYLIKKKALFPDRAGTLKIEPAEIDVSVGVGFFRGRKLHRQSAPLTLQIQPLPAGAPAGFPPTNVGQWRFSVGLTPASVPVGEPATLSMTVEGFGNVHGLTVPALPTIDGLRAYDPTSSDKLLPAGDRLGGRRQVEIILIPQRTGEFEIPPLTFQWYDPTGPGYQTTTSPRMRLRASAGVAGGAAAAGSQQNVLESTYQPLRERPSLAEECSGNRAPLQSISLRSGQLVSVPVFGMVAAVPPGIWLLVAGMGAYRERRRRSAPSLRGRRAYRVARDRLDQASEARSAGDSSQALLGYLQDRLGEPMAGLALQDLRTRLAARGGDEAAVRATLSALELAELLRYQPEGSVQARDLEKLRSMAEFALEALERTSFAKKERAA